MTQEVKLHGGPMHGQLVALADGIHHFHIAAPLGDPFRDFQEGTEKVEEVATQRGSYSRVGKTQDFEWDGWSK